MSAEPPDLPKSKRNPLRWLEPSLNGLVIFALLVSTWSLATSDLGETFRNELPWYFKVAIAIVAGLFVLALTYWYNLRAHVEEQWLAVAKTAAAVAPSLVKPALVFLLGAILLIAYHVMKVHPPFDKDATLGGVSVTLLGILCLSSTPAFMTLGVSLLVERRMARGDFAFEVNPSLFGGKRHAAELVRHAQANWEYEREIMEGSIHRMGRHAAILGFLASCILITCSAIWVAERDYPALAVATAATISFTLHQGQIFFRSASNDATARMMARASRTLLIVSICALFFGALFLEGSERPAEAAASEEIAAPREAPPPGNTPPPVANPLSGRTGALLIGIAVALIGERMLRLVTSRAASLLGLEGFSSPVVSDMSVIDGLSEEDAARLAEERIDSVHALAFTPTARIFFNTVYGLQRICDWQDQALLIERVGRTNALLLREQFFIRGAIAGRRLALQRFGHEQAELEAPSPPEPPAPEVPEVTGSELIEVGKKRLEPPPSLEVLPAYGVKKPEAAVDFDKESHVDRALRSLMDDENIEMLEVFWRSVPVLKQRPRT
ncbi:MAG: hypothetical protein JXB05_00305 [Myxococcaceae bacterium]|nr:hypothetical protein [Myxococcaceae bacterium]